MKNNSYAEVLEVKEKNAWYCVIHEYGISRLWRLAPYSNRKDAEKIVEIYNRNIERVNKNV